MAPPATPRGPLASLIEIYKQRRGVEWEQVWTAAGVRKPTLEQWISGRTAEPPLRGMLRLRRYLEIPFDEFEAAALRGAALAQARSAREEAELRARQAVRRGQRTNTRSSRQAR